MPPSVRFQASAVSLVISSVDADLCRPVVAIDAERTLAPRLFGNIGASTVAGRVAVAAGR